MQKRHLCHLFQDTMSVSLDQNCLHLSFKPYTSNKSYSRKYVKQTNVLIHAFQNITEKCGQQTWLCLFTFLPMTLTQVNNLTSIDMLS